jgi:hypothetical protein
MATTTNYSWSTPDDTALVKDGASAIRSLGTAIDTTTKALNPSTTLGDIEYRSSTANTNTRLAIGTSGQVLSVSGGVPAWTTVSSGAMTKIVSGSFSNSAGVAINQCFTSTYTDYIMVVSGFKVATSGQSVFLQFQTGTSTVASGSDYYGGLLKLPESGTPAYVGSNAATKFTIGECASTARHTFTATFNNVGNASVSGAVSAYGNMALTGASLFGGIINTADTYTGLYLTGTGNITGNYAIYGLAK